MKRNTIIAAISSLLILTIVFFSVILGDFFLMRSSKANGTEATKIMAHRYQTQDRAMLERAIEEGYQPGILMPLMVEEYPTLAEFAQANGAFPLGLEANAKLFICNEGHGPLKITTDRFGFRNDDHVWDQNSTDLVMFGDSFTFGTCQQTENTIAGHLGRTFDLRNVSFPGALPVHYAAMIKTFGPLIQADKAVLIFYSNDNEPSSEAAAYHEWFFGPESGTSRYFEDVERLAPADVHAEYFSHAKKQVERERKKSSDSARGGGKNLARAKKLLGHVTVPALRQVVSSFLSKPAELPDAVKLAADTFADYCNATGCMPLIVYIPNSQFWNPDPLSAQFSSDLVHYVESSGLPILDVTEKLALLGRAGYADSGIHLSPEGYKLVADLIAEYFTSSNEHTN